MHVMTRHLLDIVNGMLKCVCIIQVPHMHAQCEQYTAQCMYTYSIIHTRMCAHTHAWYANSAHIPTVHSKIGFSTNATIQ